MPSIQEEILQAFFQRLRESEDFDDARVEALQRLCEADKKLKGADVVKILTQDPTEAVL